MKVNTTLVFPFLHSNKDEPRTDYFKEEDHKFSHIFPHSALSLQKS